MSTSPAFILRSVCLLLCVWAVKPELMSYEPVEHLKGYLDRFPFDEALSPWQNFLGLQPPQLKNATHAITRKLAATLDNSTSVRLIKGENVLIEKLAVGVVHDTRLTLRHENVLSLLALTVPILLEDYAPKTLTDPIGQLLKGDHLKHPLVKSRESLSLLELIRDLPPTSEDSPLTDPTLLKELSSRGELAVYVINCLLGSLRIEAWVDALLSAGMEHSKFNVSGDARITTTLTELGYFAAAITYDASLSKLPPPADLYPLVNDVFLFNWWLNCPRGRIDETACLLPHVPAGTIITVSQDLRIYVLTSLDLALIVAEGRKPTSGTVSLSVSELIKKDRKIWNQFFSVLAPSLVVEEEEKDEEAANGKRILWGLVLFVTICILSHIWVYWILHAIWSFLSKFKSLGTYSPRPKIDKKKD